MVDQQRPSEILEQYKSPSAKEVEVVDTAMNEDEDLVDYKAQENTSTED